MNPCRIANFVIKNSYQTEPYRTSFSEINTRNKANSARNMSNKRFI